MLYGWLRNGEFEEAASPITIPGRGTVVNPMFEDYRMIYPDILEYDPEEPPPPTVREGYVYVADGLKVRGKHLVKKWTLVKDENVQVEDNGEEVPVSYSRIYLKIALAKIGKLQAFENLLSTIEIAPQYTALEAFNDANVIRTNFPGFDDYLATICTELEIDNVTKMQILSSCIAEP